MPNKSIYLSDELYAKLSEENEPSKLVQDLLKKHYKTKTEREEE